MATKKGRTTNFFSLLFCCCFWIRDPGWTKIRIRDNVPDPQHCLKCKILRKKHWPLFRTSCCWPFFIPVAGPAGVDPYSSLLQDQLLLTLILPCYRTSCCWPLLIPVAGPAAVDPYLFLLQDQLMLTHIHPCYRTSCCWLLFFPVTGPAAVDPYLSLLQDQLLLTLIYPCCRTSWCWPIFIPVTGPAAVDPYSSLLQDQLLLTVTYPCCRTSCCWSLFIPVAGPAAVGPDLRHSGGAGAGRPLLPRHWRLRVPRGIRRPDPRQHQGHGQRLVRHQCHGTPGQSWHRRHEQGTVPKLRFVQNRSFTQCSDLGS